MKMRWFGVALIVLGLVAAAGTQMSGGAYPPMVNMGSPGWRVGPGVSLSAPFPYGDPGYLYNRPMNVVPRESETLTAEMGKDGQLQVSWTGSTDFVSGAYVAILDKSKGELVRQRFEKPPISFTKEPPKGAVYYRVVVTYVNGAVSSTTGPIPPAPAKPAAKKPAAKKPAPSGESTGLTGP